MDETNSIDTTPTPPIRRTIRRKSRSVTPAHRGEPERRIDRVGAYLHHNEGDSTRPARAEELGALISMFLLYNYVVEMARPKNKHKPVPISISASPKLVAYLEALVEEEGYGNSKAEVAKTLVWRQVEALIAKGIIQQIRGTMEDEGG